MRRGSDHHTAFTLLELIVIFTVLCILLALMIPAAIKMRTRQQRITCVNRLKEIGLAHRIFATDKGCLFPWQVTTNAPRPKTFEDVLKHYHSMSNDLSSTVNLVCPADDRKPAPNWMSLSQTNISYFTSLDAVEAYPQSILAGDRNLLTNGVRVGPGIVNIGSPTNVAWSGAIHRFQGNSVMGDGSVQQLSSARLCQQFANTGLTSTTLAVP